MSLNRRVKTRFLFETWFLKSIFVAPKKYLTFSNKRLYCFTVNHVLIFVGRIDLLCIVGLRQLEFGMANIECGMKRKSKEMVSTFLIPNSEIPGLE